jgi:hypothetical protein
LNQHHATRIPGSGRGHPPPETRPQISGGTTNIPGAGNFDLKFPAVLVTFAGNFCRKLQKFPAAAVLPARVGTALAGRTATDHCAQAVTLIRTTLRETNLNRQHFITNQWFLNG